LAGRSYLLVDNVDDFRSELLSGEYQQYLLLSERQSLDHFTAKLLREAVNRGEGLVLAGGKAPTTEPLWETLGVKLFKDKGNRRKGWGHHHHSSPKATVLFADGIQLLETPLATASENYFGLDRDLPYVMLDNASLAATFLNPKTKQETNAHGGYQHYNKYRPRLPQDIPSITYTQYGEGKAVFMAYDLLAEATQQGGDVVDNVQANILLSSLAYTMPDTLPQRVNGVVPVVLTLSNQGNATPITATIMWPAGSQPVDTIPSNGSLEETRITWVESLTTNESVALTSWAIPTYINGQATLSATVDIGEIATYQTLALTLNAVSIETAQSIIDDLGELIHQTSNRHHKRSLKKARHWLSKAAYFYNKQNYEKYHKKHHKKYHDKALSLLLYATNELKAVTTPEAITMRLRVDELLWQWGQ
jgi:hypothetical protein